MRAIRATLRARAIATRDDLRRERRQRSAPTLSAAKQRNEEGTNCCRYTDVTNIYEH